VEKRCGFCEYRTVDEAALAEHLAREHGWATAATPSRGWSTAGIVALVAALFVFGSCGAFFLAYNGAAPFQTSDASGDQRELARGVPGNVTYTSGWSVSVAAPLPTADPAGGAVWVIPVTFENGADDGGSVGVGSCSLSIDGRSVDTNREPSGVRALGDVDEIRTLRRGERWAARLAVTRPSGARVVKLRCGRHAYVDAVFDLSPFLAQP